MGAPPGPGTAHPSIALHPECWQSHKILSPLQCVPVPTWKSRQPRARVSGASKPGALDRPSRMLGRRGRETGTRCWLARPALSRCSTCRPTWCDAAVIIHVQLFSSSSVPLAHHTVTQSHECCAFTRCRAIGRPLCRRTPRTSGAAPVWEVTTLCKSKKRERERERERERKEHAAKRLNLALLSSLCSLSLLSSPKH